MSVRKILLVVASIFASLSMVACDDVKSPTFLPNLLEVKVCEKVNGACPLNGGACPDKSSTDPHTVPVGRTIDFCALGLLEPLPDVAQNRNQPDSWLDVTNQVIWSLPSGGSSFIELKQTGRAKGLAESSPIQISAKYPDLDAGTTFLRVNPAVLDSVDIDPNGPRFALKGQREAFKCFGQYSGAKACSGTFANTCNITNDATWAATRPDFFSVNNTDKKGEGFAVAAGTSVVTCALGSEVSDPPATITVCGLDSINSIAITPANVPPMTVGATQQVQLLANFTVCDGSDRTATADLTSSATWSSTRPEVATVTLNGGLITAEGPGTTFVDAEFEGLDINPIQISVIDPDLVSVVVRGATIALIGSEARDLLPPYSAFAVFQDPDTGEELPEVNVTTSPDTLWVSSAPDAITFTSPNDGAAVLQADVDAQVVTVTATHRGVSGNLDTNLVVATTKSIEVVPDVACISSALALPLAPLTPGILGDRPVQLRAYAIKEYESDTGTVSCSDEVTNQTSWTPTTADVTSDLLGNLLGQIPGLGDLVLGIIGQCDQTLPLNLGPNFDGVPIEVTDTPPQKGILTASDSMTVAAGACAIAEYNGFKDYAAVLVAADVQTVCAGLLANTEPSESSCSPAPSPAP